MSEEKFISSGHLLKQSSRAESSDDTEENDEKPLSAHSAVYSFLRAAELAASVHRGHGKNTKRKLYSPARIRLRVDENGPGRLMNAGNSSGHRTRLRFSEDIKRLPLHAAENEGNNSCLLSEKAGKRLRFERPGRSSVRGNSGKTADKTLQYRSQQQRFTRLRFSRWHSSSRRDLAADTSGTASQLISEPGKRRLRFERSGLSPISSDSGALLNAATQNPRQRLRFSPQRGRQDGLPETISSRAVRLVSEPKRRRLRFERPDRSPINVGNDALRNAATQNPRQRLRFSPQGGRQDGLPETTSSRAARLVSEPKRRRLRFERPGRSPINGGNDALRNATIQNPRQRLRFSPQRGRQGGLPETAPSQADRLVSEPGKRRLRFERPGRSIAGESNGAVLHVDGQQTLRINPSRQYNRLRFGSTNRLWRPGENANSVSLSRLNTSSISRSRYRHQGPNAFLPSEQIGLIPATRPSETSLRVPVLTQHAYDSGSAFRYYASYVVREESRSTRFLDNGEGRRSRLKFENDRNAPPGGGPLSNDPKLGKYHKRTDKSGFFASALRQETDRMLDDIARSSEDPAVEGANAERKVASAGSRYGLKFGREWHGNHDQRVAQREVKRANKQYIRDAKEQIYQQQYGRPSRSANWRQTIKNYSKQAHRFAEQKLGAKTTAELEKIIAIIAKKGAALIRVAVAYVGAPLIGIILAFLLLLMLAMLFVGGINNAAVTVLTAYTAEDTEIEAVSSYYTQLEAELDKQIKDIPSAWEWQHIDSFDYDLDDIGHDPYQLMAYLSVKYPGFTFSDVKTELDYIFSERYTLTLDEEVEVRHRTVSTHDGGTREVAYNYYILHVTLRAKPQETVLLQELAQDTEDDLTSWYDVLMETRGAHQAYENPFDIDWTDYISSLYGYRVDPIGDRELQQHRGLDISMPTGTPIKAGLTGTVRYVGVDDIMGDYIIIDADDVDHTMKYGHCDEVKVSAGDKVVAGETVIGTVGNSGQSTGPHLHVEILEDGEYLDPVYSLKYEAPEGT